MRFPLTSTFVQAGSRRSLRAPGVALLLVTASVLASCGDSTAPDTSRSLAISRGDGQTGTVGQAVAQPPAVRVTNASGDNVSGVTVQFAVTQGGGSVGQASAVSGADGVASAGSWTLGTTVGPQSMTARITGPGSGASVTFTATATAGPVSALVSVAGDAQSAVVRRMVATAPAVRADDAFGNPVANVQVTFAVTAGGGTVTGGSATTNASGTATVGAWTLGPDVGEQTLAATVASLAPVSFTATAFEDLLQPSQDTSLSGGTLQVTRFVVSAGRTVTVSGDLEIRADSSVSIGGTLVADCRQLRIISAQDIVVTGAVENGCAAPVDSAPSLTIVASGGYDLRSGTIESGGDIDVTNDSTLTDDDIPSIGAAVRSAPIANQSGTICGVNSLSAPPARNGSDGTTGGRGANARTWTLRCRGDLSIGGTVAGQDGGNGGNGTDMTGSANASGGRGGDGGKLVVRATGIIALGAGSTLQSGSGGHGGSATATAQEGSSGDRAFSAVATGGRGGEPGLITVRAGGGVQVSGGARFRLGDGGVGGSATAIGARGRDASETMAAQAGGNATATGGEGGSLDPDRLRAFGNVLGAPAVTGGAGGVGGAATSTAGKGGDGTTQMNRNGAEGGRITANGGAGGDALARDLAGVRIASGGAGGAASYIGGMGGLGWNGCSVAPPVLGGNGGAGGSASGRDGAGGDGLARGVDGGVTFNEVGNGGRAGDGDGPGTRGAAGSSNAVNPRGASNTIGTTFQEGGPGANCGIPPGKGAVQVSVQGVPASGQPAVLGEIRREGELVDSVTALQQELILDPGTYEFLGVTIDPERIRYVLATCDSVPPQRAETSLRGARSVPGGVSANLTSCEFTVREAVEVLLLLQWLPTRALLDFSFTGLPFQASVGGAATSCEQFNPCVGAHFDVAAPGEQYLPEGVYQLRLDDIVRNGTSAVERWRAATLPLLTIAAAQAYPVAVSWFLLTRRFSYLAGMPVLSDVFNHRLFIAMWTQATIQAIITYSQASTPGLVNQTGDLPITISGPAPFVSVTGVLRPDGTISASGSGTVAGFPNVPVTFTGTMAENGVIAGQYQMGQSMAPTGLPGGPIIYSLTTTVQNPGAP